MTTRQEYQRKIEILLHECVYHGLPTLTLNRTVDEYIRLYGNNGFTHQVAQRYIELKIGDKK